MAIKFGLYVWSAEFKDDVARVWLRDEAARIVAKGIGASISAAQQQALEATHDEVAKAYLRQVKFTDQPTE